MMKGSSSFNVAFVIGFIALVIKVCIPKLLPHGIGQVNLDRPSLLDVDPSIQTLHRGNVVKIYERINNINNEKGHQEPVLIGPETVVIDYESNIYALSKDNIIQLKNLGEEETTSNDNNNNNETIVFADAVIVAKTPGFLLGGKFVPNTKILYFADAINGLCRIDLSSKTTNTNPKVELIASSFQLEDGTWSKIAYADDVDIGTKSGIVYFSDASDIAPERNHQKQWDTMYGYKMDYMRAKKSGRLLQYDPSSDKVSVLANDIWFANGVAVDEEERFVVISETSMLRLVKYHLKGPKKGQLEVMGDHFPGMPDGADCATTYCYAPIVSSIPPIVKIMYKLPPTAEAWLRTFIMMLPSSLTPKPVHYGGVAEVTQGNGTSPSQINRFFQDPNGEFIHTITGVTEHGGKLYLGSLVNNFIGVLDLEIPIN